MLLLSLIMLFVCILMPLVFARSVWRANEPSLAGWLVTAGCWRICVRARWRFRPARRRQSVRRLGAVGNSGNTTEPHLHIHAMVEGKGDVLSGQAVPLLFEGRNPVRNATFDG